MVKKILVIDIDEISRNRIQDLLDSSNYIVYHSYSIHHIDDYIRELEIALIIINQSVFIEDEDVIGTLGKITTPILILGSINFDNMKSELKGLKNISILSLSKSDKEILQVVDKIINRKYGKNYN